jgi:hypothetical protein
MRTTGAILICSVLLAAGVCPCAALTTNSIRLGIDVGAQVGGVDFIDDDAISMGVTKPDEFFEFDFPGSERVGIDALAVYSNLVIFSTDIDIEIDGILYADEDLVAYNPNLTSYDMCFDGSAAGLEQRANIDALALVDGTNTFIFSVDASTTMTNGTLVYDEDFLFKDGGALGLDTRGSAIGIPARADIDALYYDGSNLFYSLDVTVQRGDLVVRDDEVWILEFPAATTGVVANIDIEARADLVALDSPIDSDGDWLTDFEEATGLDEAASTFPGSGIPLEPNGYKSDPNVADTDGDNVIDGHEAAAGTNPWNSNDFLRITAIMRTGTADVVTWASVAGKVYDLEAHTNLMAEGGVLVENDYDSHGGSTSYTNLAGENVFFYRIKLEP